MVHCLVIGQGSIGLRHARVLNALGHKVETISRRGGGTHSSLAAALAVKHPDYAVVANETVAHAETLAALTASGFRGKVMMEKPLFQHARPLPAHQFAACYLGYPLRSHPALRKLRAALADQQVISAQIYVGQYLPDWRPGRDYRTVYSAKAAEGGGVLRDLSHELDYATWLFGAWRRVAAMGGTWSSLEIDSDDTFMLLARFERCAGATIQLNYLDRKLRRDVLINTNDHSYRLDFIGKTLTRDGEEPEVFSVVGDDLYLAMHRAAIDGPHDHLTSLNEGMAVMTMIEATEQAARDRKWVFQS